MNTTEPTVGIVAKHNHPDAPGLVNALVFWLQEQKVAYFVEKRTAKALLLKDSTPSVPREEMTKRCSAIVVLGGDGTFISVCRHPVDDPPVIIGVNLGTLGFLTEITAEEMIPTLEAVLKGEINLERRSLLTGSVLRDGKEIESFNAVNDVVISKQALARMFALELSVNGEFAARVSGDGVIVATPSGSTAYSMSAGGAIVHPLVDAILFTPICPHSLTSRPLVLPGNMEISLKISSETEKDNVYLTIDGQVGIALNRNDQVKVETSDQHFLFAKSESKNYFDKLGSTLKWATR